MIFFVALVVTGLVMLLNSTAGAWHRIGGLALVISGGWGTFALLMARVRRGRSPCNRNYLTGWWPGCFGDGGGDPTPRAAAMLETAGTIG